MLAGLVASDKFAGGVRGGRAERLPQGHVDGVELVIPSDLLGQRARASILEDHEVAHQVQEPSMLEDAFEEDLKIGHPGGRDGIADDGPPRFEPLLVRSQDADAGLCPIGGHQRHVAREQRRDLRLVGLELAEGVPHRGVLLGRVLELQDGQRQAVHEQHDLRAPLVLAFHDGELVDRQPVVVGWVVEVEQSG